MKARKRNSGRTVLLVLLAVLLLSVGAGFLARPTVNRLEQEAQAEEAVASFFRDNSYEAVPNSGSEAGSLQIERRTETDPGAPPYPELLEAMRTYNEQIYSTGQCGLSDPWCYTASVIELGDYGLEGEAVGVLTIPKMDYEAPVYLGATAEHLNRGAAQLSISSMPIGGVNTNCVLAGHRGWQGALHFRNIELLELGDLVTLTNLWEVLTYEVVEIKIIEPWQPEQLLIQEGRDLLTLLTCHPYGSGGKQRYVVVCERKL